MPTTYWLSRPLSTLALQGQYASCSHEGAFLLCVFYFTQAPCYLMRSPRLLLSCDRISLKFQLTGKPPLIIQLNKIIHIIAI